MVPRCGEPADTVRIPDREDALRFVAERLREFRFADVSPIFSISARLGLEAKQAQDALQLQESGIPWFENELSRFLFEERAHSFLLNTYERTMTLKGQDCKSNQNMKNPTRSSSRD